MRSVSLLVQGLLLGAFAAGAGVFVLLAQDRPAAFPEPALAAAAAPDDPDPAADRIVFTRGDRIDLGTLDAGSVPFSFGVRNDGSGPVTIGLAQSSCHCTELCVRGGELRPGEVRECSGRIGVAAERNLRVTVRIAFQRGPRSWSESFLILCAGRASARITASPPAIRATVPAGQTSDQTLVLAVDSDRPEADARETQLKIGPDRTAVTVVSATPDVSGRVTATLRFPALEPGEERCGAVEVTVGVPPRATLFVPFAVKSPNVARFRRTEFSFTTPPDGKPVLLGTATFDALDGWTAESVRSEPWLRAELRGTGSKGSVTVNAVGAPPSADGESRVVVVFHGSDGAEAEAPLHVHFGRPERRR